MPEEDLQHSAENLALKNIQQAMAEIREKVTRSVTLISTLRDDRSRLAEENGRLQAELATLREQLAEKSSLPSSHGSPRGNAPVIDVGDRLLYFSPDEREALERQINELLERINSHLR